MLQIQLNGLLEIAKETGRLAEVFANWKEKTATIPAESQEHNKKILGNHAKTFASLDLNICRLQCERIAKEIHQPADQLAAMMRELAERMFDECQLRVFVSLSVRQAQLAFADEPLFGPDVNARFPGAAFEIEEAGKCLGFSRPTAAVFHCMRVMEIGIAAISRCLGIPDPIKPAERNWGAMLRAFKAEFTRRSGLSLPAQWANPDRSFFEDAYASLDAVRNPWRNATMHVENKYTDDEAEHIFSAVKAFMKKLAARMDEQGEPKCP